MASEHKTFPVEHHTFSRTELTQYTTSTPLTDQHIAEAVDKTLEALVLDGWRLLGAPWVYKDRIFLTMQRER